MAEMYLFVKIKGRMPGQADGDHAGVISGLLPNL